MSKSNEFENFDKSMTVSDFTKPIPITFDDSYLDLLKRIDSDSPKFNFRSLDGEDKRKARTLESMGLVKYSGADKTLSITSKGKNFLCNKTRVPSSFKISGGYSHVSDESCNQVTAIEIELMSFGKVAA